jgi:SAM-dependent methyltransferase
MRNGSLDYAFLKHIGVSLEGEKTLHGFYLPFLKGAQKVLDLGCGLGGFVKLLIEAGIDALGVDSDPQCVQEAREHQLPVIEAHVIDYLKQATPNSLDGIFSSHLVEHLPYESVLEIIHYAFIALRPGGRLILTTPNPGALITHLELFPLHFGHLSLYHPKLLGFFMVREGFVNIETGENPDTKTSTVAPTSPLACLEKLKHLSDNSLKKNVEPEIMLRRPVHSLGNLMGQLKAKWLSWALKPYGVKLESDLGELSEQLYRLSQGLSEMVQALDRPFECYAVGDKA